MNDQIEIVKPDIDSNGTRNVPRIRVWLTVIGLSALELARYLHISMPITRMSFFSRIPMMLRMLSPRKKNSKGLRVADDTTGDIEQQQHGVPSSQTAVLLYEPRQAYHVVHSYPVPDISNESEVLVRVRVIGLNPIDWKGPYVEPSSKRLRSH